MKFHSKTYIVPFLIVLRNVHEIFAQRIVRFEKFNFTSLEDVRTIQYPITSADATFLREHSNSSSVLLSLEACIDVSFPDVKRALRGKGLFPPPHPEDGDAFWKEFNKVMKSMREVKKYQNEEDYIDPLPKVMPRITHLWNGKLDIIGVAKAVHDEFPGVYHAEMITDWLSNNALSVKSYLFPKMGNKDFLRFQAMLSDLVGHAIQMVGPCNFSLKWEVGRARPEEVAWKIRNGEIKVPRKYSKKIYGRLWAMNYQTFDSASRFTAYHEGSPTHPSYPAMHSAASAASFWLDVTMTLTEEQRCEARMLDWSIAYARTVAGVHYGDDNIAGLMVGQEILAQKLPKYLQEEYGADINAVKDAVKAARFDWTSFESSDCWTNCKYVKFRTRQFEECSTSNDQ